MASEITVAATDVQNEIGDSDADVDFEVQQAQILVNDELVPYAGTGTTVQDRLEMTGTLMAIAFVTDDGNGPLSSIDRGSSQVSFRPENEDALTYWRRAIQMDPTGQLQSLEDDDFWSVTL